MWRQTLQTMGASVLLVSFPAAGLAEAGDDTEEDTYLVGFEKSLEPALIENAGGRIGEQWERIHAAEAVMTEKEAARLASRSEVAYVELDQEVKIQAEEELRNWGLEHVQAPDAWEENVTGEGVEVAVVDTGISTSHPSLDVEDGYSAVSYTDSYDDDNGHGSHTAGIIGASQPRAGLMGVAPDADLIAVKVLDESGNGSLSQVLTGMEWAIEEDVDIINMSFGTLTDSSSMKSMLQEAYEDGIIVAAASGNRGEGEDDTDRVEYPARYDSVVAVAAVDDNNERAYFSASGEAVELSAPGVDIVSTYEGSSYGPLSGTSMATPFVSGAFALLKEAYPEEEAPALRSMLQEEALDLGEDGRDERYGYGLLQLPDLSDAEVDAKEDFDEEGAEQPVEEDIEENPIDDDPIDVPEEEADEDPPSNVQSEIVTNEDGSTDIYIFWDQAEDGISHHRVYRNGGFYEAVDNGRRFKDENVTPGTYRYEVTVVDSEEEESDKSETIEVVVEEDSFSWPDALEDPPSFEDIGDDYWAAEPIRELSSRGVIQGSDGQFRPGETVRRGQALAMLGRVLEWDEEPVDTSFSDVGEEYFGSGFIKEAVEKDIISGFSDGTFRPNDSMTRGQMAAVLGRVFDFVGEEHRFSDVGEDTTGAGAIAYLAEHHIVTGYDDGTFRPGDPLSRAQFASIFHELGGHLQEK
ncbi:S8 family peptidase [Salibacterium aidingense]|uniref:S8 family peptidase n=1 Tax=Salibacterium aidingense TaxID=384933 RepID=UPI00040C3CBE|nr:S8 family serine peptidase [Salibacterium aidingense]